MTAADFQIDEMRLIEPALCARAVTVRFGGVVALRDVSVDFPGGVVTGLIGPNGAGKSTLVNVLSGVTRPTSGSVEIEGRPVRRWGLGRAARSGISRSFQESRVFLGRTVLQNIAAGGLRRGGVADAGRLLELLGLEHRSSTLADDLPYGEIRRLGVAIAMAAAPRILLLDEPGAGLAGPDLDELGAVIRRIREGGTTVVLIDHNMRFLMETSEHVVVLDGGQLISEGTPRHVQADPRVRAAYLGGDSDVAG